MNALTVTEQTELERHEAKIKQGLQTFVEVGAALVAIRDCRLYRVNYSTFEDYCTERWGMSNEYARLHMRASEVVTNLQQTPTMVGVLPTSERQARPLSRLDPEAQSAVWQRAVETAPNGKVTAAHVETTVKEYKYEQQVNDNRRFVTPVADEYEEMADELAGDEDGYDWTKDEVEPTPPPVVTLDSNEWYTPVEYIEAARRVMGSIDLDPASNHEAQEFIKAGNYYTKETNGLAQVWIGNVWLNPPYADPLPWVSKLIDSYTDGDITEAILLVNTANSPEWSRLLWHSGHAVCLLSKRVRFWRPDREDAKGTAQDQMIWYIGNDPTEFEAVFSAYGAIR